MIAALIRGKLGSSLEIVQQIGRSISAPERCPLITKIDRLARNTRCLGEIVETLHQRGVGLKVLQFGRGTLDTTGAYGQLMFNMFLGFRGVRAT